jgi:hypothetical protein
VNTSLSVQQAEAVLQAATPLTTSFLSAPYIFLGEAWTGSSDRPRETLLPVEDGSMTYPN